MVSYAKSDWAAQDTQSSIVLDVLFYISHVFRMQAFFWMAGYFAHLLYHRQGPTGFVRNRVMRLLVPFGLFWPLLYGLIRQMWVWGLQRNYPFTRAQAVVQLPTYMVWDKGFPLMHLWFLYFLLLFCGLVVLIRPLMNQWIDPTHRVRQAIDWLLQRSLTHWWGGLALGLLMVGPMLGMRDWFGVDTSASGLVTRWAPFCLYGLYFSAGWFVHRQPHLLAHLGRYWGANLGLGTGLIVVLIGLNLAFPQPTDSAGSAWALLSINTLYAFASITSALAFIGYMLVRFKEPNALIRYGSDSAYWGYLVHLPVVIFLQIVLAPLPWLWPLKLGIILGVTVVVVGLSYQYGVRKTWVGRLLNGRRYN